MDCIFCKIINGEIPSKKVYEDEQIYAFYDIQPQAPTHILVIPKKHIESMAKVDEDNIHIVAHLIKQIPLIAKQAGLDGGFRIVSNAGDDACQSVHHLHFHILGGKKLSENMA